MDALFEAMTAISVFQDVTSEIRGSLMPVLAYSRRALFSNISTSFGWSPIVELDRGDRVPRSRSSGRAVKGFASGAARQKRTPIVIGRNCPLAFFVLVLTAVFTSGPQM